MDTSQTPAQKLANFAACYHLLHTLGIKQRLHIDIAHEKIVESPLQSLILLTAYLHERAGASPLFPVYHRQAIRLALDGKDDVSWQEIDSKFREDVMDGNFADKVWEQFLKLASKPNKKYTIGPVKGILNKLYCEKQPNVIQLLCGKSLEETSKWLKDKKLLKGIGPKLRAFILRDIACYFKPEWKNDKQQRWRIQPVDRWILRWAEICFQNCKGQWKSEHDKNARMIDSNLLNVDPVKFNQGAWFAGSYFARLCAFFSLPESYIARGPTLEALDRFDVKKVKSAIELFVGNIDRIFGL